MSKKICRLCLSYPSVCFSLLETKNSEMLEALTSIKVDSNDVLSTISCMKCILNIKLAFHIQQSIIKADEKLKQLDLLDNVEVKLEVSDITMEPENHSDELLKLCCANCVICGVEIADDSLVKHVQEHFNEKQQCELCHKLLNNIEEYKTHILHKHKRNTLTTQQKCTACDVTFRYKSLYNIHMKHAHKNFKLKSEKAVKILLQPESDKAPYSCDICSKEFQCKRQLKSHSHQRKKCPVCDAEITKSNLKKHIMNHSSGPQVCELCGATLRSLESLRGHMAHTHSTVVYTCDECGRQFNKRYAYLLHKKKHSGEKSNICESCGKSFLTFYYLNKHIKTAHLKLRPFVCDYCKKGFSSKFALRTHVRQHTNETPYKCEVCGEGFRQNVSLRAHRKSKHNIIEPKTCACPVCGKLFGSEQAIISHMRLH